MLLEYQDIIFPWIRQIPGNGETTYFWSSNWSPFGKLSDFLETSGSLRLPIPKDTTLAELWEYDSWILPNARSDRQLEVISFLSSLCLNDTADTHEWRPQNNLRNKLFTGMIYGLVKAPAVKVTWHKEVWFSGGIQKHKFLTWLIIRNRCPTRDRMLSWGFQTDP